MTTRRKSGAAVQTFCAAVLLLAALPGAGVGGPAVAKADVDPVAAAIESARAAQIVIVGEIHDNPQHHAVQARFAAELALRAIVFEMFPQTAEAALARARARGADPAEQATVLNWADLGWPPYEDYVQIMDAAPDAVLLGGLVARADARASVAAGAAPAFGATAGRFGLASPLPDAEQAAREDRQAASHCDMLPPDMLPGMVEVQRLRDAVLARAALRGLDLPGSGPVLVITGNGHADLDWGVPAVLRHAAPNVAVYTFTQIEGDADQTAPGPGARADAFVVTPPRDRPDPCAAFRDG